MTMNDSFVGSTFDSWLDEHGLRDDARTYAVKAVLAEQIAQEMQRQSVTKTAMARRLKTSRAQLDRLLDPKNGGVTLETLQRAAAALGRGLRLELI